MTPTQCRKALFAEIRQAYNNQNVIRLVKMAAVFSRMDDAFANEYIVPQLLDYIVALDDTRHGRLAISEMKHYNAGLQHTVNLWIGERKMAKNKRPRKHYRPKPCYVPLWTEKDKSNIKALFEHAELVTMLKLQTGEATMDDLCCIRDALNLCLMGCMTRDWLDKAQVEAAEPVIRKAGLALMESVDKCIDRNPLRPRYVFTGDAIKAIQAGVAIAGPYINDSIDELPDATVKELFAMKHLTRGKDAQYAYTPEQLKRAIDKNSTIEWSKKA